MESKDASFTEKAIVIEKITTAEKEQITNNSTVSDVTIDNNEVVAQSSSKAEQQSIFRALCSYTHCRVTQLHHLKVMWVV